MKSYLDLQNGKKENRTLSLFFMEPTYGMICRVVHRTSNVPTRQWRLGQSADRTRPNEEEQHDLCKRTL